MKLVLTLTFLFAMQTAFAQSHYLLTGSYTKGKSRGIYCYRFDERNGSFELADSAETPNPSYLAVSPDGGMVRAVNELQEGSVTSFAFDKKTGRLSSPSRTPFPGVHPCYITLGGNDAYTIAGNYSSGNFVVLRRGPGTALMPQPVAEIRHEGSGPNAARQKTPHVHATVLGPGEKQLFVTDLGTDKLMLYDFNAETGAVRPSAQPFVSLAPGSGPRHLEFHPNGRWLYLLNELTGTVAVFRYQERRLDSVQLVSALPEGFDQAFTSADIHVSPNGKFLYASNRDSSNTIAIFRIHPEAGTLTPAGHQSTLGRAPRNFTIHPSGRWLLVANQNSDSIVIFRVDEETGLLTDSGGRIDTGSPVCLKWVERE